MKEYRGYTIDGIVVTEADIDTLIEAQNPAVKAHHIERMQCLNAMMLKAKTRAERMICSIEAQKSADFLHKYCGMSLRDIEAIEFA